MNRFLRILRGFSLLCVSILWFYSGILFSQVETETFENTISLQKNYTEAYEIASEQSKNLLVAIMSEKDLTQIVASLGVDTYKEILERNVLVLLEKHNTEVSVYEVYARYLSTGQGFVFARNDKNRKFTISSEYTVELSKIYPEKLAFLYGKNSFKFNPLNETMKRKIAKMFPVVQDSEIHREIFSQDAFWYDESIIPRAYQDAIPPFTGIRPNSSDVSLAVSSFFQEGDFPFPLDRTAGTRSASGVRTVNIMLLPKSNDNKILPVVYYERSTGSYHGGSLVAWTFPVGTKFVEVLIMTHSDRSESIFELRSVKKDYRQWSVEVFRPFDNASELSLALNAMDASLLSDSEKANLVASIDDNKNLKFESQTDSYGIFHAQGASKVIPAMKLSVAKKLLSKVFVPVAGKAFQSDGKLESYGATGPESGDSFVPRGYKAGSLQVDSDSCKRCHNQTTRLLQNFDFDLSLYGNVWGSDQRFSFHPFNPAVISNGESMGNRFSASAVVRGDFIRAGILDTYSPSKHPNSLYPRLD